MPVSKRLPVACAMLLSLALAACNHDHNPTAAAATPAAPASAAADKYEPAKMDLKPPPKDPHYRWTRACASSTRRR